MSTRNAVYPGIVAPASTKYDLTTEDAAFDLSTVTAARLLVIFDDETEATWDCTTAPIAGVDPTQGIQLIRLHQVDDLPPGSEGFIRVRADCDLSGGGKATGFWKSIPVEKDGT